VQNFIYQTVHGLARQIADIRRFQGRILHNFRLLSSPVRWPYPIPADQFCWEPTSGPILRRRPERPSDAGAAVRGLDGDGLRTGPGSLTATGPLFARSSVSGARPGLGLRSRLGAGFTEVAARGGRRRLLRNTDLRE